MRRRNKPGVNEISNLTNNPEDVQEEGAGSKAGMGTALTISFYIALALIPC